MPTEKEFNTLMDRMGTEMDITKRVQKANQKAVAVEMSLIKNDPRWKVYEDHMLVLIAHLDTAIEAANKTLSSDMSMNSEAVLRYRTLLHGFVEKKKGLEQALTIVDDLIVKGESDA